MVTWFSCQPPQLHGTLSVKTERFFSSPFPFCFLQVSIYHHPNLSQFFFHPILLFKLISCGFSPQWKYTVAVNIQTHWHHKCEMDYHIAHNLRIIRVLVFVCECLIVFDDWNIDIENVVIENTQFHHLSSIFIFIFFSLFLRSFFSSSWSLASFEHLIWDYPYRFRVRLVSSQLRQRFLLSF